MPSNKSLKTLYGTMFEIITDPRSMKKVAPTQDVNKAVVIIPETSKRCPFCSSDKCLVNFVGETLSFPRWFKNSAEVIGEIYLYIALCKKLDKEFIIERSLRYRFLNKDRCVWCGSNYIEKVPGVEKIRKSLLSPSRIKKYEWVVWADSKREDFDHGQLEGMTPDEQRILIHEEPWICKHCKRVFGYKVDQEGHRLFDQLIVKAMKKGVKRYTDYGVYEYKYRGNKKD